MKPDEDLSDGRKAGGLTNTLQPEGGIAVVYSSVAKSEVGGRSAPAAEARGVRQLIMV
jgi:hypothetical protein